MWQHFPQHVIPAWCIQWALSNPIINYIYLRYLNPLWTAGFEAIIPWLLQNSKPYQLEVIYDEQQYNQEFIKRCPYVDSRVYNVCPFLDQRPLVESIIAGGFVPRPTVKYLREIVRFKDGGQLALDWTTPKGLYKKQKDQYVIVDKSTINFVGNKNIMLALAGTGGDTTQPYMMHLAKEALEHNLVVATMHWRGHGFLRMTSPSFFGESYTSDLNHVVGLVRQRFPNSKIFLTAISIGANVAINFLAKEPNAKEITACISLGNPFDMEICGNNRRTPRKSLFFSKSMADLFSTILHENKKLLKEHEYQVGYDLDATLKAQTLREFDIAFQIRTLGYKSKYDYDRDTSSGRVIDRVDTPTLFINSYNDPVCIMEAIPFESIRHNKKCMLIVTPSGGHMGWISGEGADKGSTWANKLLFQYINATLDQLKN